VHFTKCGAFHKSKIHPPFLAAIRKRSLSLQEVLLSNRQVPRHPRERSPKGGCATWKRFSAFANPI